VNILSVELDEPLDEAGFRHVESRAMTPSVRRLSSIASS
jgi:hypothetical protein